MRPNPISARKRNETHSTDTNGLNIYGLWHRQRICTPKNCVYKLMCTQSLDSNTVDCYGNGSLFVHFTMAFYLSLWLGLYQSVLSARTHSVCHTQFNLMVFFHLPCRSFVRSFIVRLCEWLSVAMCAWMFCFLSERKQHWEHNEGFIFVRYNIFFFFLSVSVSFATMVSQHETTQANVELRFLLFVSSAFVIFSHNNPSERRRWPTKFVNNNKKKMCVHVLSTTKRYMDDCALFACMHACMPDILYYIII